jgi:isocitrate dehydrogenase kinase/phosphatase
MLHFFFFFTNICTEYFKHAAHSPFFSSSKCRLFHNATFLGSCIIHILYTGVLKCKRKFRRQRVKQSQDTKPLHQLTAFHVRLLRKFSLFIRLHVENNTHILANMRIYVRRNQLTKIPRQI